MENLSTTNESRRAEAEQRIAEALKGLLSDGIPWRDITVEKIAAAAGIKRTLFYVYYSDRNAVLIRIGKEFVDNVAGGIASHWLVGDDSKDGVREQMRRFYDVTRDYSPVTRALMDGSAFDDEIAEFWKGLVISFVEPTKKRIDEIQAAQGITDGPDSYMTALCLVVMTGRVALQPVANDPKTSEALFEALFAIWTDALFRS